MVDRITKNLSIKNTDSNPYRIGVLEGEGIGPEIIQAALSLLVPIELMTSLHFEICYGGKIGLAAQNESGRELTPEVISFCEQTFAAGGAIFCGPGGGRFVYDLRKTFDLFYKLVPIQPLPILEQLTALKAERLQAVDILVVRENSGGLYQGEFAIEEMVGNTRARHSFSYDTHQIARIAKVALSAALIRRKKICVIIKPGGIPTISALWKQVTESIIQGQDIELSFLEIDNAAYQVIANAQQFDVILAPNLFGDIIADGATLLLGSRGLSYSANFGVNGEAVYQTGHGSAYDIMGQNCANPIGQIYSLAYLLETHFGLIKVANDIRSAVEITLAQGIRTVDIMTPGATQVSTKAIADHIGNNLKLLLVGKETLPSKQAALLLIDGQENFLKRLDSDEAAREFTTQAEELLRHCREQRLPIIHIHTNNGSLPIEKLKPLLHERVIYKQYYNAFRQTELENLLQTLKIDCVIIAGLYTHACVQAAALEAYERGYQVWIIEDAIESYDPIHAELTRKWLAPRAASFIPLADFKARFDNKKIKCNSYKQIAALTRLAKQTYFEWRRTSLADRLVLLTKWKKELEKQTDALVILLCREIGKPRGEAYAEVLRALAHIDHTVKQIDDCAYIKDNARVKHRPSGCYAVITPWNNPIAIPVSKIAPALFYGNTVVWKPAEQTPLLAQALLQTLIQAGADKGLVNLLSGDKQIARELIKDPHITAVTLTGSIATGRRVAALCSQLEKPLQAELGGNNACIIMDDVDLTTIITDLALSAFSFAGQRCTAIRRFIVQRSIADKFERLLPAAIANLMISDPSHPDTQIGPLISEFQLKKIKQCVVEAIASGARLLCGGHELAGLGKGYWFAPTLFSDVTSQSAIVQQESFGPIAVIQIANDIEQAVCLANDVPHGLLACLITHNTRARAYFEEHIEAGILKFLPGPLHVLPEMPFGGWKASRMGPPEHGEWDRYFYTRPQAIYD